MTQVAVIHSAFEETSNTVAFVEVGERTGNEALEYAYRWTQNLQGSWSREGNPDWSEDVTVMAALPVSKRTGQTMGLRSTSMGDFMLLNGVKYEVSMVGFKAVA